MATIIPYHPAMHDSGKTILLTAGEDIILRNIYLTDFWPRFVQSARDNAWRVVLVTTPNLLSQVRTVAAEDAEVVTVTRTRPGLYERIIISLVRSGIDTHTNTWEQMRGFADGQSSLAATWLKRLLSKTIGRSTFCKRLLRVAVRTLPPDPQMRQLLNTVQPDVVATFSLVNRDFDVLLAREARRRGLPLLGMVRSWDNLTSHGLLTVVPDEFFLQNDFLKEMARRHQVIDEKLTKISVVGLPHYDEYFHPKDIIPREELFKLLGLDSSKKLVLYGAMGEFLFRREADMPRIFERVFEKTGLGATAQLVFRAHPAFVPKEGYGTFAHVRIFVPKGYSQKEEGYTNEQILMSTIVHADLVITCGSTFAIDAYVLNRPVVCVGFDGEGTLSYWNSVARYYDRYTHYEELIAKSKIPIVRDEQELATVVQTFFAGTRTLGTDERRTTLARFTGPSDGRAGEHLAAEMTRAIITKLSHK